MSYIGNLDTYRGLIGKIGEDMACLYLISIGHEILHRNLRIKYGEVDIVTRMAKKFHFVEVKTVKSTKTTPEEHLDFKKLKKIGNLAELFYKDWSNKSVGEVEEVGFSIDFIGVTLNQDNTQKKLVYLESLEV